LNQLYLPDLEKIEINNYSLYNQNLEYEFIKGVNLIIGGNGVGKTTFINILKYSIIGLYKKDTIVRNYNYEKRISRERYSNPNLYFRSRTKQLPSDLNAEVCVYFSINGIQYIVKRSLYNAQLLDVEVIELDRRYHLEGESFKQDDYDKMKETEKESCIQFKYEQSIKKNSNLDSFDDFIFFVNRILLFDETRETILWDEDIQKRLSSTYFNNPELERERKEAESEKIYQNSISRHKSEEIKAINRVFKTIETKEDKSTTKKSRSIQELFALIDKGKNILEKYEVERNQIQNALSNYYKDVNDLSNQINAMENELASLEENALKIVWNQLNPKYAVYKSQLQQNEICPFCNKPVDSHKYLIDTKHCFFCNSDININEEFFDDSFLKTKEMLDTLYKKRQAIEVEIGALEKNIRNYDYKFRQAKNEIFMNQKALREIETSNLNKVEDEDIGYHAMIQRIEELTKEKDLAISKSKEYEEKANNFIKLIEHNLINITSDISDLFADFAEAFLKLPCHLSYDNLNKNSAKTFIPSIDNVLRKDEEELSESQRFFIDYSFRMSVLSFFYNGPTYYICETPDSSLDISYEINAARTFMKFLEKPNILILTSNLNNSTFIDYLIEYAPEIRVLNLLKYGKTSIIQNESIVLQNVSKQIEEKINAKIQ